MDVLIESEGRRWRYWAGNGVVDACLVKDETYKVAWRYDVPVVVASFGNAVAVRAIMADCARGRSVLEDTAVRLRQ